MRALARIRECLLLSLPVALVLGIGSIGATPAAGREDGAGPETPTPFTSRTRVSLKDGRWIINGRPTHPGSPAEGLLMNVRMVNATFEDSGRPDFDPEANTSRFLGRVVEYAALGVDAVTLNLQGGTPGYEGAVNSAFAPDGSLRASYLDRVRRVVEACDRAGVVVILGCFYQRQDQVLNDEAAVRAAVVNVAGWLRDRGYRNVVLEMANEFGHNGFDHESLRTASGQIELVRLAKEAAPGLLVSTSGLGDGRCPDPLAEAVDFLLIHFNNTPLEEIPARAAALRGFKKPIVCNEDAKVGEEGARAAKLCVENRVSWGLMAEEVNQHFPFRFEGAADDPTVYAMLQALTSPRTDRPKEDARDDFPAPESQGGWRKLDDPDAIRRVAGMDPEKLEELREWLRKSDRRGFAAVVIRRGAIVLEEERGNSAITDSRRIASCSKAVCATVLAIASEQSRMGLTPRRMSFDDKAFDFIPWAQPLSDPRKAQITVKQLLNHTSGICPEATGADNDGTWEYTLGHAGDPRTEKLAFDPGTACGYSTHALAHAALVCENVTGKTYDEFAIEALFQPLGIEHWWFQYYEGGPEVGRHPSHGLGMPARDMARIAYCMLREGRWNDRQVIPKWYVEQTAAPTHDVHGQELRFKINAQTFSHGWELPARLTGEGGRSGQGIPADARSKPGSGGQLIAFVPSLDLVVVRQTGGSGPWEYEEYLRRACAAVVDAPDGAGDGDAEEPAAATVLGVRETQFTINGEPVFLLGISDYGALGAKDEDLLRDLDDMRRHGFNWLRVWATWSAFDNDVSAVDARGRARAPYLDRLKRLVAECDRRGLVVDVTLTRREGGDEGGITDFKSHQRAVETLVAALKDRRNWYLDLANERDVGDARFVSADELKTLRGRVRELDPQRLVTASFGGHELSDDDIKEAILAIGLDFLAPHRPRSPESPKQTEAQTRAALASLRKLGHLAPILYQEPFRRGYTDWEPSAADFLDDLRGAVAGGAAGWCLHNGSQRGAEGERPRRSFDLRDGRLFDQLDATEREVVARAAALARNKGK